MFPSSFEEAAKELASFGLTGNQAKVYVALVKLKVAPVSRIAHVSKVRREEVYRAMPKLERLGMVEKILGKPIKYKSILPEEALSILFKLEMKNAQAKIAEMGEKRRRLLKQLKSLRVETRLEEEEGPHFVLILDREQAVREIATMIGKAKKSIAIATPRYGVQLGYAHADVFRRAVRKGVKARILLEIDELDDLTIKMLRDAESLKGGVELKHVENLTSHTIIVDDAQVMVGTFLMPTLEKHVDLWTNNIAYVDVMKAFFDKVWQDSVDVRSRIECLQTGKPVERTEVVKGRNAIYKLLHELNSRAKTTKLVTIDGSALAFIKSDFATDSTEMKKRGVRVRYLTNITAENLKVAQELAKQFEVKHTDSALFRCLLTETEAVFAWVSVKDLPDAAIYSNDAELVRTLWKVAESTWDDAVDAQSRIDEIKKEKPMGRVSKPIVEELLESRKSEV